MMKILSSLAILSALTLAIQPGNVLANHENQNDPYMNVTQQTEQQTVTVASTTNANALPDLPQTGAGGPANAAFSLLGLFGVMLAAILGMAYFRREADY